MWTPEKKRAYQAIRRNQLKRCSKCLELKTSDKYYHWSSVCKPCRNAEARINRQKNITHYKAKWKEYERKKRIKSVAKRKKKIDYDELPLTKLWHESGNDPVAFTIAYKQYYGTLKKRL